MRRTVLLIDSDPTSVRLLGSMLDEEGYRTLIARDAAEGVASFVNESPDLTLVQDALPTWHGFEVCADLKRTRHGARSLVVLMVNPVLTQMDEIANTGCDDYVEKPCDGPMLLRKLRMLLPDHAPPERLVKRKTARRTRARTPTAKPTRSGKVSKKRPAKRRAKRSSKKQPPTSTS